MGKQPERSIVVRGSLRTIEHAMRANGAMLAESFVETLDEKDQRRLGVLFRRMADTGKIHNKEQFKKVRGKIYEFKRHQVRVGCFQAGAAWRLTHGFIKKTEKWPEREIERAQDIMKEDLEYDTSTQQGTKGRA